MTCSTTSAPWSNASTPGSRTNSAPGSCACAAPSRSNAISCSASSPSPSIKYSACPRCKKLRVDQLAAQVSEKSPASQIMQEALLTEITVPKRRLVTLRRLVRSYTLGLYGILLSSDTARRFHYLIGEEQLLPSRRLSQ